MLRVNLRRYAIPGQNLTLVILPSNQLTSLQTCNEGKTMFEVLLVLLDIANTASLVIVNCSLPPIINACLIDH
jgi:hypothetical protein